MSRETCGFTLLGSLASGYERTKLKDLHPLEERLCFRRGLYLYLHRVDLTALELKLLVILATALTVGSSRIENH
jgi:hypothetical protein